MGFEEFIKKLAEDQAAMEKMSTMVSIEDAFAYAKELGFLGSQDEFMQSMSKLNEASSQMSASDVDAIVGGLNTSEVVSVVASTVGSAAACASAAI